MASASASATVESSFYHPQHLLASAQYSKDSTYACAACERIVTGLGYRCDECDFNIHEACFRLLPGTISSFDQHEEHGVFTLTCLGASRSCGLCKVTSQSGSYMYLCGQCDLGLHPRCTNLLDEQQQKPRRRSKTRTTVKVGLKVVMFGFRVTDVLTGGFLSPALDVADLAIGHI